MTKQKIIKALKEHNQALPYYYEDVTQVFYSEPLHKLDFSFDLDNGGNESDVWIMASVFIPIRDSQGAIITRHSVIIDCEVDGHYASHEDFAEELMELQKVAENIINKTK